MVVGVYNQYVYGGDGGVCRFASISRLDQKMDQVGVCDRLQRLVGENRACKTTIFISIRLVLDISGTQLNANSLPLLDGEH